MLCLHKTRTFNLLRPAPRGLCCRLEQAVHASASPPDIAVCFFAPPADDPDAFMNVRLDPLAACPWCWHPYRQPCNLQSWVRRLHNFVEQPLVVAVCADLAEVFLVPGHKNEDRIKNTAIGIGRGSGEELELVVQPGRKLL